MSQNLNRIVYKPLGVAEDLNQDEDEEEEDEDEASQQPFATPKLETVILTTRAQTDRHPMLNMNFLRILLYLLATLLFLAFVLQLGSSSTDDNKPIHLASIATTTTTAASLIKGDGLLVAQNTPTSDKQHLAVDNGLQQQRLPKAAQIGGDHIINHHPSVTRYDNYLSSVLKDYNHKTSATNSNDDENYAVTTSDEPIDDLHFPLENSGRPHGIGGQWWVVGSRGSNDTYVTLTNYIRRMKSFNYNASVTLTTQATTEFMHHTLELCKRWDGPISVAVFTPDTELQIATSLIKFMRQCLPSPLSACIRDKVTWHLAYPRSHGPQPSAITYPRFHLDSNNFPLFVDQDQCPKFKGPEPVDLIKQFHVELCTKNQLEVMNFCQKRQLPYPINVLRNTARKAATTNYLLASDIELYPSINIVPMFINFINKHNIEQEYSNINKYVFTLPIFEVDAKVEAPKTKQELTNLMQKGQAVFFHKYVCDACQKFPNRLDWLMTDKFGLKNYRFSDNNSNNNNELVIFDTTRRNKTRNEWEPIFIGTDKDPVYDDRLTWDGRRDKMGQMFEMCLMDYHLLIAGNAFLVHAPGIKRIDKNDVMKRRNYIRENNLVFETTISKLRQQYANSKNINIC